MEVELGRCEAKGAQATKSANALPAQSVCSRRSAVCLVVCLVCRISCCVVGCETQRGRLIITLKVAWS